MFEIRQDDLTDPRTQALLALHLAGVEQDSPAGHATALDLSALRAANITVWSAWDGEELLGVGALKICQDGVGEIKSMRTEPRHLRRGVGRAILRRIIAEAREQGLKKLNLQTANTSPFAVAVALYHAEGFVDGDAFGEYAASEHNSFLHKLL